VKAGADINAKDPNGKTPLVFELTWGAMTGQKPEVIAALAKADANINVTDPNGGTPLMYAANNEHAEVLIPAF
jgi:ankyrin repeat protein